MPKRARPGPSIEPRWLDAASAARYISVTPDALYHMVQRRQIPFVLKGRRLFFDRLELDRWMLRDAHVSEEAR